MSAARCFALPGGSLAIGAAADVVLLDLRATSTVDPATFYSKSRNSPFLGQRLPGRVIMTLVGGRVVHEAQARPGAR